MSLIGRSLGYEQPQGRLTCLDWMHSSWSVLLLAPVASALAQGIRLVAQRLVTAAVTKYVLTPPACSRPDCSPRWGRRGKQVTGGDHGVAVFLTEPRFALVAAG